MINELRLFIGEQEVEFSADPKIAYNYAEKDLLNPTVIRNSFSRSIELPSTPQNNNIFNHYWDLQRYQDGSLTFDALSKTPFTMYYNGALIEKGYCKLDNIKGKDHNFTYSITLYGGLGSFFYGLSYNEGDENNRKTLASLQYVNDTIKSEPELNFRINKETVNAAWDEIMGDGVGEDKWNVINFVPAYNGIPEDFDADKMLVNFNGLDSNLFKSSVIDNYTKYETFGGYSIMEHNQELTEWQTYDLRSYLQRPAVSVKRVIEACCQPQNNGGWQVKLDSHFFNNNNPYWNDGWCTLPMLRSLDISGGEEETVSGATISYQSGTGQRWTNLYNLNHNAPTLSSLNNARLKLEMTFTPSQGSGGNTLYGYREVKVNTGLHIFNGHTYVSQLKQNSGVIVQLQAVNNKGNVVATSDAYFLGQYQSLCGNKMPMWDKFEDVDGGPVKSYNFIYGVWKKSGSSYYFSDENGNPIAIEFILNNDTPYTTLRLKIQYPDSNYCKYAWTGADSVLNSPLGDHPYCPLYTAQNTTVSGDYTKTQAMALDRVMGIFRPNIISFEVVATDYEALFSNSYVTKDKILGTDYTPAEFLISYAKTFGLYFYIDPAEEADSGVFAPAGVVHIMDRDTFFTDEYVDIEKDIDRGRDLNIQPLMAESKWYEFKQEQIDSECAEDYRNTYGNEYGRQLITTNYNFNDVTKQLYDGNVFKGGIMVREKDRCYIERVDGIPPYVFYGASYALYNGDDTYDVDLERKVFASYFNINTLGLNQCDLFPKLQCHSAENSASDGDKVLLFFKGGIETLGETGSVDYYITDDTEKMAELNEGQPCWILTNSEDGEDGNIAILKHKLPFFTRDLVNFGIQEGNIVNSWNFGHPQTIYVQNTNTTEGDSIYDKCWKSYINDVYDRNTKVVTAYVHLKQQPHPSLLRKWWYFDGGIWRLNAIKDWNIGSAEPVKCEFVKVQDIDNYKLEPITYAGYEGLVLDEYNIGQSGGTIQGHIYLQSGGRWFTSDSSGMISYVDNSGTTHWYDGRITPYTGQGSTSVISISIPENDTYYQRRWNILIEDDYDNQLRASIVQEGMEIPQGSIKWSDSATTVGSGAVATAKSYIVTNMDESTIYSYAEDPWVTCTVNSANSRVTLNVEPNPLTRERSTIVTINGFDINGSYRADDMTLTQIAGGGGYVDSLAVDKTQVEWYYMQISSTTSSWFTVTGTTAPYIITVDDSMFGTNPTAGTDVTVVTGISKEYNYTFEDKKATASVTDGHTTKEVQLIRYAVPHTSPLLTNMIIPSTGAVRSFRLVFNNQPVYFDNVPSWINLRDGTGGTYNNREWIWPDFGDRFIFMDVNINNTGVDRVANIQLKNVLNNAGMYEDGPVYQPITVSQETMNIGELNVSKSAITWSYTQKGATFDSLFDVSGTSVPYTITSTNEAFAANPTAGTGIYQISAITLSQNYTYTDKVGKLIITDGITTKEVSLRHQAVPHIEPQYQAITMPATGQQIPFEIITTGNYCVYFYGKPDWLTITDNNGRTYTSSDLLDQSDVEGKTFYFNAANNVGGSQRTAFLQIKNCVFEPGEGRYADGPAYYPVQITQVGEVGTISWNVDNVTVGSGNTSTAIGYTYSNIRTDEGTWVNAIDDDNITIPSWVTCTNNSATGIATITVQANTGNTARHTNIDVNAVGDNGTTVWDRLVLTQERSNSNLVVNPLSLDWLYPQALYQRNIGVTGDTSYTASTNNNHFTISPSTGTGATNIVVTPTGANAAYTDKVTTVTITDGLNTSAVTLTMGAAPHCVPDIKSDVWVMDPPPTGYTTGFTFAPILPPSYFFRFEGMTEWCYFTEADDTPVSTSAYWTDDYKNVPAPWFKIKIEPIPSGTSMRSASLYIKTYISDVSETYLSSTYRIDIQQWE